MITFPEDVLELIAKSQCQVLHEKDTKLALVVGRYQCYDEDYSEEWEDPYDNKVSMAAIGSDIPIGAYIPDSAIIARCHVQDVKMVVEIYDKGYADGYKNS